MILSIIFVFVSVVSANAMTHNEALGVISACDENSEMEICVQARDVLTTSQPVVTAMVVNSPPPPPLVHTQAVASMTVQVVPQVPTPPIVVTTIPSTKTEEVVDVCSQEQYVNSKNGQIGNFDGEYVRKGSRVAIFHNDTPASNVHPEAQRRQMADASYSAYAIMDGNQKLPLCEDGKSRVISVSEPGNMPGARRIKAGSFQPVSAVYGLEDIKMILPADKGSVVILKFIKVDGGEYWRYVGQEIVYYDLTNGAGPLRKWLMSMF